MPSISTRKLINTIPTVLAAGGRNVALTGMLLTQSPRVPIGSVISFSDASDVADTFGATALETAQATNYFLGFTSSSVKPGMLLMSQYNTTAVGAWLRGGPVNTYTLSQLRSSGGSLTVTIDGTTRTFSVDLSTATSFSSAASTIQAALVAAGATGATVVYDVITGAFQITSGTVGTGSSINFASGGAATTLCLTSATGAVLSQGAAATDPLTAMYAIVDKTTNWASFWTTFEPVASDKLLFASWVNGTDDRYTYICWDTDASPTTTVPATSSVGYAISNADYSGVAMVYQDSTLATSSATAAMIAGSIASLNFDELNGRATFAYKSQTGLLPVVTSRRVSDNLDANGYTYYGSFADDADDTFNFLYNGAVSGPFAWLDSYVNQIWMNAAFRTSILNAFLSAKSIPYNQDGYALIKAALLTPIRQALAFGAIRAGVTLTEFQAAQINGDAGGSVDQVVMKQGWYLQISDAPADVRAARDTPPCKFWYTDGESIQKLTLNSIAIQ